jgi:hypothetical protein
MEMMKFWLPIATRTRRRMVFSLALLLAGCSASSAKPPDQQLPIGSAGISAIGGAPSTGTPTAGSQAPVLAGQQGGAGSAQMANAGTHAGVGGAGGAANAGAGSSGNSGMSGSTNTNAGAGAPPPVCVSKAPMQFALNTSIGGGGPNHKDSDHFAVYAASDPDTVLNFMEAAHKCFIEDWCFRTPGLSAKSDDSGPYSKTNIYSDAALNAGGLTYWDANAELAYIHILASQITDPRTTVHEYGHAITMSEFNWIDQKRTGYWWETVANWVAYSFLTSPYCESARTAFSIKPATTIIDQMHTLQTVYGMSYTVICNDQNYYQAWPFLTYLTNNPDNYPGLGKLAVQDLMRKYQLKSNETPLHTLDRIAAPIKAQTILGRYWARMAYMDIGLPVGQKDFLSSRASLNFGANWDSGGSQTYTVKANRKPQYGGANITPLKVSGGGDVSVTVTNLGNGLTESNFTATLSIRASDGSVRYVDLPKGTGSATVGSGEEASLVVVNTPDMLYQFDPQYIGSPENVGLNYQVQITGATPAN